MGENIRLLKYLMKKDGKSSLTYKDALEIVTAWDEARKHYGEDIQPYDDTSKALLAEAEALVEEFYDATTAIAQTILRNVPD